MNLNRRALMGEHLRSLACIALTVTMALLFYFGDLMLSMTAALTAERYIGFVEAVVFGVLVAFLIYGSLVHQLARLGWVSRSLPRVARRNSGQLSQHVVPRSRSEAWRGVRAVDHPGSCRFLPCANFQSMMEIRLGIRLSRDGCCSTQSSLVREISSFCMFRGTE
jgi:hypothetical protein